MVHREYEKILRQLEAECRTHIKCEQQMKLHIECLQEKMEQTQKETEIEKADQEETLSKLKAEKDQEIATLKLKINDLEAELR